MPAVYDLAQEGGAPVLRLAGDWTLSTIAAADEPLLKLARNADPELLIDLSDIARLDAAGAYLIERTLRIAAPEAPIGQRLRGGAEEMRRLIETVREAAPKLKPPAPAPFALDPIALLAATGRLTAEFIEDALETLAFLGATLAALARLARAPSRIRWTSVVAVLEEAGLNAAPIIALLSFFVGVVIAYVGVSILSDFGAAVFTVELVGFSVLREFAVVITAILLAGRTDSAFAAEIGAMRMRQEIDAMRVLGLDVGERIVAPRVIAMTIAAPLLTFVAMIAGVLGGLLVAWGNLGVSPALFLTRIQEAVGESHFWVGMSKAPVFGFVLAVVGCRHGLKVGGDVASLGRQTTAAVVQGIFLVIVLDALFAIWFLELGW